MLTYIIIKINFFFNVTSTIDRIPTFKKPNLRIVECGLSSQINQKNEKLLKFYESSELCDSRFRIKLSRRKLQAKFEANFEDSMTDGQARRLHPQYCGQLFLKFVLCLRRFANFGHFWA